MDEDFLLMVYLANQSEIDFGPPTNFSIKDYQFDSQMMNVTLQWERSDSLVTGYQVRRIFHGNRLEMDLFRSRGN